VDSDIEYGQIEHGRILHTKIEVVHDRGNGRGACTWPGTNSDQ